MQIFIIFVFWILIRMALSAILMVTYDAVADWQGWKPMPFWIAFAVIMGLGVIGSLFRSNVEVKAGNR